MDPSDDPRALRAMIQELRDEQPPELDWDRIEGRLMAEVDRRETVRALRPSPFAGSVFPRVAAFAAAAALIALGIGSLSGQSAPRVADAPARVLNLAAADPATAVPTDHDLSALAAGEIVETGDQPATFHSDGVLAWTLAPRSRARVRSMGAGEGASGAARGRGVGHTIALEVGSVRAEVTPRDPSEGLVEAFAVEVEGTRVAVHGTAFTVTRAEGSVVVDVEHGSVAVGPIGHDGATTGHLLVGPARAGFSLDGGRHARFLPRPEVAAPVAVAAPSQPAPAAAGPGDDAPGDDAPPPGAAAALEGIQFPRSVPAGPRPSAAGAPAPVAPGVEAPPAVAPVEPPSLTVGALRARLGRCFASAYAVDGSSSVKVSVSSTFHLVLRSDGTVQSARFDPPLKPAFQSCAAGAIGGRFADGTSRELTLPLSFDAP